MKIRSENNGCGWSLNSWSLTGNIKGENNEF